MKKNLLTIGLIALSLSVQAQNVLLHVDNTAKMYVSEGTLVYNGGGMQTKGSGMIDNHGNIMVVGTSSDVLKTLDASGVNNTTAADNIILRINNTSSPVTSTYGQLYIKGIPQSNITGFVKKEYASTKHGAYQQIGIPFLGKELSQFSTETGGALDATRWSGKEILKWSNANVRFDGDNPPTAPISSASAPGIAYSLSYATTESDKGGYFTVGTGGGFNPEAIHTISGKPFADGGSTNFTLNLTPSNITTYGPNGNNTNVYRERYNTYIWDVFETATSAWGSNWGKNIHQFSNPYLTNLDLSRIGYLESGSVHDGNAISNIKGIAVNPSSVTFNYNTGGTSATLPDQMVTFNADMKPAGNLPALIIKPLGTFKIKLKDSSAQTLAFDNLRRFNYTVREDGTSYAVTAAKNGSVGTMKQLGVLALDANGNQIGETYYVVSPDFITGQISAADSQNSIQATTTTNAIIQTFEESITGGADQNLASNYRLYINEANEVNFRGKKIDLSIFGSQVASLKFEIRDDTALIPNGNHLLSSGTGFYYSKADGQVHEARQGDVIPVNGANYGVYYGAPQNVTLSTTDLAKKSRTVVTYNPEISNYIVRFDPSWKSASVEVFDASGKLVIGEKSVKADSDYVIKLDSKIKAMYVVKILGNDGTLVNTKILIK